MSEFNKDWSSMSSSELSATDKDNLYTHWMKIWDIIPDELRTRFKHENGCLLCESHKQYLQDLQRLVREDKLRKSLLEDSKKNQE